MGLGYTRFSITPAAVGPIKELVRKVYLPDLTTQMQRWMISPPPDMREALSDWAVKNDIDID
jgi:phosphotransferase system enzyme I (PtsP)